MNISYRKVHTGWLIYRVGYPKEYHGHLRTENACVILLKLIKKNQMPKSKYLRTCIERLLTLEEWENYKKISDRKKQKYVNINKGCRRVI